MILNVGIFMWLSFPCKDHICKIYKDKVLQTNLLQHCTSFVNSGQLAISSIYLNVNQLGWHKGLTLYLWVIIICVFFPPAPDRLALVRNGAAGGKLSLLVRDWPVGIIRQEPRLAVGFVAWWRETREGRAFLNNPSLSLLASWTCLTFHLGSSWSPEIFNWMESLDVFWKAWCK